jgi:hypothetical protein
MISSIFIAFMAVASTAIAAPGLDKKAQKDCTTLCETSTYYEHDCAESPCPTSTPGDDDCATPSLCVTSSVYDPPFTTCSTSFCTSSSIYTVPTTIYETATVYIPITSYDENYVTETKTLTSQETNIVTTYSPSTITTTTWLPVITQSVIDVPYITLCTERSEVPYVTSSASLSVCEITSEVCYTTAWVETETICSTGYFHGGRGSW